MSKKTTQTVKQETDPNRYFVYVVRERNDDPEMPGNPNWLKIGILAASIVNEDEFYGRIRALNQGNPRGLEVIFYVMTNSRKSAAVIEKAVHRQLKDGQVVTRAAVTEEAGHSEWFKVSIDVVQPLLEAEHNKFLANNATFASFFEEFSKKEVAKTRQKSVKIIWTREDSLFSYGDTK